MITDNRINGYVNEFFPGGTYTTETRDNPRALGKVNVVVVTLEKESVYMAFEQDAPDAIVRSFFVQARKKWDELMQKHYEAGYLSPTPTWVREIQDQVQEDYRKMTENNED